MSTTVIECLLNAQMNLKTAKQIPQLMPMVEEQLANAIQALENGLGIYDVIQEEAFGPIKTSKDE